jgi:hypothetical protein
MSAAFGPHGGRQAFHVHSKHLTAQEQDGAQRLILRAGRDALSHRQMGYIIPHRVRLDARMRHALSLGHVGEEAPHPVRVAALCSVGVVPGPDALSQLFERRQGIRSALLIHDGTGGPPLPVCSLEEVSEVVDSAARQSASLSHRVCGKSNRRCVKPVDWRPPLITGILWIWRRDQSTVGFATESSKHFCRWQLTGSQDTRRMIPRGIVWVTARGRIRSR